MPPRNAVSETRRRSSYSHEHLTIVVDDGFPWDPVGRHGPNMLDHAGHVPLHPVLAFLRLRVLDPIGGPTGDVPVTFELDGVDVLGPLVEVEGGTQHVAD